MFSDVDGKFIHTIYTLLAFFPPSLLPYPSVSTFPHAHFPILSDLRPVLCSVHAIVLAISFALQCENKKKSLLISEYDIEKYHTIMRQVITFKGKHQNVYTTLLSSAHFIYRLLQKIG